MSNEIYPLGVIQLIVAMQGRSVTDKVKEWEGRYEQRA